MYTTTKKRKKKAVSLEAHGFFVGPTPTIHKIQQLLAVGYPMDLNNNKDNKASKFSRIEVLNFV